MKILEKFVLILYSLFILIISVIMCLIVFKVISMEQIKNFIEYIVNDWALAITVIGSSIVCMLLSVRCLFFRKKKQIKKSTATDILLENESGRLLISKAAIENAVNSIVKESLRLNTDTKVTVDIDPAENVSIYIFIMLDRTLKVRELTLDLQVKIKNEIKDDFGVEVKQVNIKVDSDEKKIEKLERANEKEAEKIEKSNEKELQKLEKINEKEAVKIERINEKEMQKLERANEKEAEKIKKEHEKETEEIKKEHERKIQNLEQANKKEVQNFELDERYAEIAKSEEDTYKTEDITDAEIKKMIEDDEKSTEQIDNMIKNQIELEVTAENSEFSNNKIEI